MVKSVIKFNKEKAYCTYKYAVVQNMHTVIYVSQGYFEGREAWSSNRGTLIIIKHVHLQYGWILFLLLSHLGEVYLREEVEIDVFHYIMIGCSKIWCKFVTQEANQMFTCYELLIAVYNDGGINAIKWNKKAGLCFKF